MKNQIKFREVIAVGALIMFELILGVSLTGCATYVPIKSVRPPTIDTSNIQRLAIKPFENKSGVGGTIGAQLTQYLTEKATQLVVNSGKFTIVSAADPNAEGVFSGEIRNIESKDSQTQRERTDKEGNTYYEITYLRNVSVVFVYSVTSSRTGMPIGQVTRQESTSSSSTDMYSVTDTLTLAKRIVDNQLRQLQRDIVPTIVSENRKLMNETSKDKVVKQRMKTAMALVRNGNYEEAIRQFDDIGREYGSAAAMTNANILRESVSSDAAARAKLTELFNDTGGLAEKASKGAVAALNSKLPSGTNIIIVKSNSRERSMLDYVVDQMTKNIVQTGKLRIVDRSNQSLIDAEQQYQLSGNVSDDSIVSIGHQLGAQYIVLCWISGEMSARRLNIKVLNVETSQVTDQNDFEI